MYQSDWILRQIELLGTLLKRMLAALREQRPDEVLRLAEEAIGEVLDLDVSLVDSLAPEALPALLGAGGEIDPERATLLGEVLAMRAAALLQTGDDERAAHQARAAWLLFEPAIGGEDPKLRERADNAIDLLAESGF